MKKKQFNKRLNCRMYVATVTEMLHYIFDGRMICCLYPNVFSLFNDTIYYLNRQNIFIVFITIDSFHYLNVKLSIEWLQGDTTFCTEMH